MVRSDTTEEPFILSIFPFRVFNFFLVRQNAHEIEGKIHFHNETTNTVIEALCKYIGDSEILKFAVEEHFVLICFFCRYDDMNFGSHHCSAQNLAQQIWSKKFVSFASLQDLLKSFFKSCLLYRLYVNKKSSIHVNYNGDNICTTTSSFQNWQNKVACIWDNHNANINSSVFPITAIESVNDRYESFHSFLVQVLEMYAQEQNGECDRARKSVLDILLIAMREVTEESLMIGKQIT